MNYIDLCSEMHSCAFVGESKQSQCILSRRNGEVEKRMSRGLATDSRQDADFVSAAFLIDCSRSTRAVLGAELLYESLCL